MKKALLLITSHLLVLVFGFMLGIYMLPILSAPPAPENAKVKAISKNAQFHAAFLPSLKGSDLLHYGDGEVSLSYTHIAFLGSLAPGPEYKLYLSPQFIETEAQFEQLKSQMVLVGDVNTFDNFIVAMDGSIELSAFNTVIVWCEAFGEFITAAKYR